MIRLNKTADIIYDKENLWHGSPQDQLFSSVRYLTLEIEVSLKISIYSNSGMLLYLNRVLEA